MVDPKKLLAFMQRENGVKPAAPAPAAPTVAPTVGEEAELGMEEEVETEGEVISEEEIEEIAELIAAGEGDPQLLQLAAELVEEIAEFGPEVDNPPSWVANEGIWEEAKAAVDPDGEGAAKYPDPWAVVTHVYKRMGGVVA